MVGRSPCSQGNETVMSLINEALKKAQTDRPGSSRPTVPMDPGGMPPVQQPPKKKRYLFSFIIIVLLVGLMSALVSTYLVLQIMGDDETAQAEQPSVQPDQAATGPGTVASGVVEIPEIVNPETAAVGAEATTEAIDVASAIAKEAALVDAEAAEVAIPTGQPIAEELPISVPEAVVQEQQASIEAAISEPAPAAPVEAEPEPVAVLPVTEPSATPTYASGSTNPEIWRRLDEFEIRGIMSRGAKVLIYDSRTEKARTYTSGDLIDGALSLRVATISSGEIQFTNNEGSIFTKAF